MNMTTRDLPTRRSTSSSHIELKLATPEHVNALAAFLGAFFAQSGWAENLEYDERKAHNYLSYGLSLGQLVYLLAMEGEEIVGVCSYHTFDVFKRPIAVMDETYTIERLRHTDLGRRMIATIIDLATTDGCGVMNFPICSGMREQNSLMNMVGRHFGARPTGMIFTKVL